MIVVPPLTDGTKVTEQVAVVPLPERVHVVELKLPEWLDVKVTVPLGVAGAPPPVSVTVAVHVVGEPVGTGEGLQTTVVVVGSLCGNAKTLLFS